MRSLLTSPQYPLFVCPNCRAGADLEADVDEPSEEWQQLEEGHEEEEAAEAEDGERQAGDKPPNSQSPPSPPEPADLTVQDVDAVDTTVAVAAPESPAAQPILHHATTEPLPISSPASNAHRAGHQREKGSPSLGANGEGLVTPRNNAGPWVFDGSAGRRVADAAPGMRSLDATAGVGAPAQGSSGDSS